MDAGIIVGALVFFFSFCMIGAGWRNIPIFIDVPGAVLLGGMVLSGLLIGLGFRGVMRLAQYTLFIVLGARDCARRRELAGAAQIGFRLAARLSWVAGALGTLICGVLMSADGMDDPNKLTQGTAVALLTLVYGAISAFFFRALQTRAEMDGKGLHDES